MNPTPHHAPDNGTGVRYVVVKIGGRPASNPATLDALVADIGRLAAASDIVPVLVHGGGADVTELSKRLGLEPKFVNGKRQTSAEEMQVVEAVLAGNVNTRLLRRCLALGVPAVGLSGVDGGLFTGEPEAPGSRTGRITAVDTTLLRLLGAEGWVPVVSSVSCERGGEGLNINADDAAMALAIALDADSLVYLSDIPGILKDGAVIPTIDRPLAQAEIASGVIGGGMIPKVNGSLDALDRGVRQVVIGGFEKAGDLGAFLEGKLGTRIFQGDHA